MRGEGGRRRRRRLRLERPLAAEVGACQVFQPAAGDCQREAEGADEGVDHEVLECDAAHELAGAGELDEADE